MCKRIMQGEKMLEIGMLLNANAGSVDFLSMVCDSFLSCIGTETI